MNWCMLVIKEVAYSFDCLVKIYCHCLVTKSVVQIVSQPYYNNREDIVLSLYIVSFKARFIKTKDFLTLTLLYKKINVLIL